MDNEGRLARALAVFLVCLVVMGNSAAWAQIAAEGLPNFDLREQSASKAAPGLPQEKQAAAEKLRGYDRQLKVEFDPVTRSPRFAGSAGGFLTGAAGEGKTVQSAGAIPASDPHRGVKAFLNEHSKLFGHDARILDAAIIKRDYVTAHSGMRTVIWEQKVDGIPVFAGILQAHLTAKGELVNVASNFLAAPEVAANRGVPNRAAAEAAPAITAAHAVAIAAGQIAETVNVAAIATLDGPPKGAEKLQRLSAPGLNETSARLVWLPLSENTMTLCWEVVLTSKKRGEMYRVVIDAQSGDAQVRDCLTEYISNASYRIFTSDSPSPYSPGLAVAGTYQPPTVARVLVTTPALSATSSPNGWISDGINETLGNNVDAHTDLNSDDIADLPRPHGSPNRVFDFAEDLSQAPSAYRDAAVTQLFYWCNFFHDKAYELGFTEAAGNFQTSNFGRGGVENDAVQADAQDGSGLNNANFSSPSDGSPGRMQMYIFSGPTPQRDGDLDAEIILHEHTHGLSSRLVGGGVGISSLQTRGMGEGWSDFYALALLSEAADDVNANYAVGGYVTLKFSGLAQNYYYGIRRYPCSTNLGTNPLTFKDIDPNKASSHTGIPRSPAIGNTASEVHNQGEVWCVTLWDARANLIAKYGWAVGNQLILQLVTDGMKLSPANPTFLQARDAILQADLVDNGGANKNELWNAFAKRGMGSSATGPVSTTTTGVTEAFDLPDDLAVSPSTDLSATASFGGAATPSSATYTLLNRGASPLSWRAKNKQSWLVLSQTTGTLAPGASTSLVASLSNAIASLPPGTYTDTITIENLASGFLQARGAQVVVGSSLTLFSETFESGTLNPAYWTSGGTSTYRTKVTGSNSPHGGSYHVTMDSSVDNSYERNELTLTLNLQGRTGVTLSFWVNEFSDEPNGPPAAPFTGGADFDGVAISADGSTWWEVQGLRSLTGAYQNLSVDLDTAIAAHGLSYNSAFKIRFNHYDNYSIPSDGFAFDDITVTASASNLMALSIPSQAAEGTAALSGTVSVLSAPLSNLSVSLVSSDPTSASVPASVQIAAGQFSATFPIAIQNDTLLNGSRSVQITASAAGIADAAATITVDDNETATLSLSAPASSVEGAGTVQGVVSISAAPAAPVSVGLSSSDPTAAQVPASVVVPAGQTSAAFPITIIDDSKIDGTQTATLTAHVANWTDGSATLSVLDNETKDLAVSLPASLLESGSGSGSVSIPGTLPAALTVSLSSSHPGRLSVPATVTIPAGAFSASFPLNAPDNFIADGGESITINAAATSFTSASGSMNVLDNDLHHFTVSPVGTSQIRNAPFAVTITAKDLDGNTLTSFASTANLSAIGSAGGIPLSPAISGSFTAGIWTGNVAVTAFSNAGIALVASDGAGHSGQGNSFTVGVGPMDHFAWDPIGTQAAGIPFPVTLRAVDAGSNPVTGFSGSASLGGSVSINSGTIQVLSWTGYSDNSSTGEYQHTKTAISTYFGGYAETSTTVTDPAALAAALEGKQVFLVPEQETAPTGAMASLAAAWSSVLAGFVSNGGTIIVCSYVQEEHLLLTQAGLLSATKGTTLPSASLIKPAETWLNAGVSTPFAGYYLSPYTGVNGDVSLQLENAASSAIVASREIGLGRVVLIGTDFFTLGTDMDRVIANAVSQARQTWAVAIAPNLATGFVNGVWTGNLIVSQTCSQLKLSASGSDGSLGESNSFDVTILDPVITVTSPAATLLPGMTLQGTAFGYKGIHSLIVSGSAATTSDGYAHWSLGPISLATGSNSFNIVATDGDSPSRSTTKSWSVLRLADANGDGLPDTWQAQHGLTAASSGPSADPDSDGIPNLLEYALGLNPRSVDVSLLPSSATGTDPVDGQSYLYFSYRRWISTASAVQYVVETSSDLLSWSAEGSDLEAVGTPTPNADGVTETVTVRLVPSLSTPGASRKFIRLRVSLQ